MTKKQNTKNDHKDMSIDSSIATDPTRVNSSNVTLVSCEAHTHLANTEEAAFCTRGVKTGETAVELEEVEALTPEAEGRYLFRGGRDEAEIGRGGLGRVLIAMDRHLGREIAVKELFHGSGNIYSPSLGDLPGSQALNPEAVRFLREARITAQLEHPNIVPVYELGHRCNGTIYYGMKLVRGKTLRSALSACDNLAERLELLSHYTDLCHAIAYAHSRGVVHRDIKPENVMVGEFGETVVLDWGLAKMRGTNDIHGGELAQELQLMRGDVVQTVAGAALGTPSYMSPEQARGEIDEIDERSDVWSLGVVLYELLTGRLPFRGRSLLEIIQNVLDAEVPAPEEIDPNIPPELVRAAITALSKDKAQRYASAAELARDIEGYGPDPRLRQQLLEAELNLAQAFNEKAERLLVSRRYLEARIFAAASLVHNPANPKSPRFTPGFETKHPETGDLRTRSLGVVYQSGQDTLMRAVFDRRVEFPLAAHVRSTFVWPNEERWAAVTGTGTVVLGKRDGTLVRSFDANVPLTNVALFADAAWVAAGGADGVVRVWGAESGARIQRLCGAKCAVGVMTASPDGQWLVAGYGDGTVWLWDTSSWNLHHQWKGHVERITALAFTADSLGIVTGDLLGVVSIWDIARKQSSATWKGHGSRVTGIACSPNQPVIATTSIDRLMRIWDSRDQTEIISRSHEAHLYGLSFTPDGSLLCEVGNDGVLRLWDPRNWDIAQAQKVHVGMFGAAFSPEGRHILSLGTDSRLRLWELLPDRLLRTESGGSGHVLDMDFSPDGEELAFGGFGNDIFLWHLPTRRIRKRLACERSRTWGLRYSPDGRALASGDYRRMVLWGLRDGTKQEIDVEHPEFDVVFSDAGNVLSFVTRNGTMVCELDMSKGRFDQRLEGARTVAISPDERWLATSTRAKPTSVLIYERASGRLLHELEANPDSVWSSATSPDGRWLATGGMLGSLLLWDTRTFGPPRRLIGHCNLLNRLHFSSDSALLASASDDCTARIWAIPSGETKIVVRSRSSICPIRFAPDGRSFALGDGGMAIIYPVEFSFWNEDAEAMLDEAQQAAGMVLDGFLLNHREGLSSP